MRTKRVNHLRLVAGGGDWSVERDGEVFFDMSETEAWELFLKHDTGELLKGNTTVARWTSRKSNLKAGDA